MFTNPQASRRRQSRKVATAFSSAPVVTRGPECQVRRRKNIKLFPQLCMYDFRGRNRRRELLFRRRLLFFDLQVSKHLVWQVNHL